MTIGAFDSDGKPFVSLNPSNLMRKWGVSNYFFWGGLEFLLPRHVSRGDVSRENV